MDGGNTGAKTINQVRPKRLLPLVVYHKPKNEWYVVPPFDVIELVENKKGQHGICPLENCTLSFNKIRKWSVATINLKDSIRRSFLSEAQKQKLDIINFKYNKEQKKLSDNHIREIKSIKNI